MKRTVGTQVQIYKLRNPRPATLSGLYRAECDILAGEVVLVMPATLWVRPFEQRYKDPEVMKFPPRKKRDEDGDLYLEDRMPVHVHKADGVAMFNVREGEVVHIAIGEVDSVKTVKLRNEKPKKSVEPRGRVPSGTDHEAAHADRQARDDERPSSGRNKGQAKDRPSATDRKRRPDSKRGRKPAGGGRGEKVPRAVDGKPNRRAGNKNQDGIAIR